MSAEDYTEVVEEVGGMFAELFGQTYEKVDKMEAPEEFGGIVTGLFVETYKKLNSISALHRVLDDYTSGTQQTSACSVTPYKNISVTVKRPEPPVGEVLAITNAPYGSDGRPGATTNTETNTQALPAQPVKFYKNDSSPSGVVVIFNYIFKKIKERLRKGARRDHENLHAVFTEMGYEVWPINIDKTRQETLEKLDEIRNSSILSKVDSLIIVFLSHGGPSENEFLASDEKTISVDEILYTKFTDQNCPLMKDKPKLFIFNYCRGPITPSNPVQFDNWRLHTHQLEPPSDVAVIQATLPHFKAGRYSDTGTIFVSEFCKVLEQYSGSMELAEIIHETSNQMRKDALGNTPTVTPIHFGKFKFA